MATAFFLFSIVTTTTIYFQIYAIHFSQKQYDWKPSFERTRLETINYRLRPKNIERYVPNYLIGIT